MPDIEVLNRDMFTILSDWGRLYQRAHAGDESAQRQLQAAHARLVSLGDALWTPEAKP